LTNCSKVLLRLPPVLPPSVFSLPTPPPSLAMCPSSSCPVPPLFAPRAVPAPRHRSPPHAGPLPTPPRRAAAARVCHASRQLPAAVPTCSCLLLDIKHVPELFMNSLLHSRTCISTAFLLPVRHAPPELRRSSCLPSIATPAASHTRSNTPAASPPPTDAHKPTQFKSPVLDRPDHYAGELELPPPLGLAVVPPLRRLSAPDRHTTSTTSSHGSCLATSLLLSCPPATETPPPFLRAPPPAPVRRRYAATVPLFPNTGHSRDRVSS
jgi:hypothetical protein